MRWTEYRPGAPSALAGLLAIVAWCSAAWTAPGPGSAAEARLARADGQLERARQHYARAIEAAGTDAAQRAALRLELGDTCWQAGDAAAARQAHAQVARDAGAPVHLRSLSQLRIALSLLRAGDDAAARAEYISVGALPGTPSHHVWEARQRLAELEDKLARRPADPVRGRTVLPMSQPAMELHVAPAAANGDGSSRRPFASIEQARDAIRQLKQQGGLKPGGVAVIVHGGDHPTTRTVKLTAADSGTPAAPIVYRAAVGESPRFTGGTVVKGFAAVRDPRIAGRLAAEAREKIVAADLKAQGITGYGPFAPGGFASGRGFRTHPQLEVFYNGEPLTLARWPNTGYARIAAVSAQQATTVHGVTGSKAGQFHYDGDRPARWKDEPDLWLYGYFFWDWADSYEQVAAIDPARKLIGLKDPVHRYGFRKGQRYYAVNALCEIDAPGEWYLDRTSGVLYLWPPGDMAGSTVEVSLLGEPMLELDGAAHIQFRGLTWDLGRADAIRVSGGAGVALAGCAIRRFAGDGVVVQGGRGHGLLSCDIHSMGRGGLVLHGGDRATLAPSGHFLENCHIHGLSRIDHTYTPAVHVEGVGHRIANNLMHRSNSSAMRVEGNDHLVERNEVHSVLLESDDQGGVDMWGNPTYRGNVFRYNFFHHIGNGLGTGQAGIRLDDAICGTLIQGNLFYRCSDGHFGGVQIHGGKDNWVEGNVMIDCRYAISFSPWGASRWGQFLAGNAKKLAEVAWDKPLYGGRYPELLKLREGADINRLWSNVALRCGKLYNREVAGQDQVANILLQAGAGEWPAAPRPGQLAGILLRLPINPIPLDGIGLYTDAFRRELPRVTPVQPGKAGPLSMSLPKDEP